MYRRLTVLAQDPGVVRSDGSALTTQVAIPLGPLSTGPRGSRIEVVDYDASTDTVYGPYDLPKDRDAFEGETDIAKLVADPRFHAQNAYAVIAATLFEFERALGRYLPWGFEYGSHQIKVFPHAFNEPNAFYSKRDECIAFGYFRRPDKNETVFTCLSHDIIAHETTHGLVDGLRDQLTRPSSPDQAAFHEGFADIVALLMVLRNEELVSHALRNRLYPSPRGTVDISEALQAITGKSFLNGLADSMGTDAGGTGRDALRRSTELEPSPDYYTGNRYLEPHDRGEILVAAVMRAFLAIWKLRLEGKVTRANAEVPSRSVAAWRVAEEGAKAAQHLLRIMIRSIDYLPPVHVDFRDFLSAVLTADWQACPDDGVYGYRHALVREFKAYGITPASKGTNEHPGVWGSGTGDAEIQYRAANIDSMRWSPEAIFNLLWVNYEPLRLKRDVFTRVSSVRPVWRIAPDGFILRETVAEYYQLFKNAGAQDLRGLGIKPPDFMKGSIRADLVGGGALIFDEFARLKFHIHNHVDSQRQAERLQSLNLRGQLLVRKSKARRFAELHRRRAAREAERLREGWS